MEWLEGVLRLSAVAGGQKETGQKTDTCADGREDTVERLLGEGTRETRVEQSRRTSR